MVKLLSISFLETCSFTWVNVTACWHLWDFFLISGADCEKDCATSHDVLFLVLCLSRLLGKVVYISWNVDDPAKRDFQVFCLNWSRLRLIEKKTQLQSYTCKKQVFSKILLFALLNEMKIADELEGIIWPSSVQESRGYLSCTKEANLQKWTKCERVLRTQEALGPPLFPCDFV